MRSIRWRRIRGPAVCAGAVLLFVLCVAGTAWREPLPLQRVFVTSLGHNNEMIADPIYLGLVTRGLLWTVNQLQDDGTPTPAYRAQ